MTKSHKVTLARFADVSLTLESATEDSLRYSLSFAVYSDFDEPQRRYITGTTSSEVLDSFLDITREYNREIAR